MEKDGKKLITSQYIPTASELTEEDLKSLISLLDEKNDEIRYQAFLALQSRSQMKADVYPFWETLAIKLNSDNSYQRSIGIMLIAENMKWDEEDRFAGIAESYLSHCRDEKFITSRQTIQSIQKWIGMKPQYADPVKRTLLGIDINSLKDTQRKLILLDIIGVLAEIQKTKHNDDITDYLFKAMTGGILDKKSIKQVEKLL
ncbi:MAG: hypothetical protein AAGU75_03185 [Bacillota bacterium]